MRLATDMCDSALADADTAAYKALLDRTMRAEVNRQAESGVANYDDYLKHT